MQEHASVNAARVRLNVRTGESRPRRPRNIVAMRSVRPRVPWRVVVPTSAQRVWVRRLTLRTMLSRCRSGGSQARATRQHASSGGQQIAVYPLRSVYNLQQGKLVTRVRRLRSAALPRLRASGAARAQRYGRADEAFLLGLAGIGVLLVSLFFTAGPFCSLGVPRLPDIATGNVHVTAGSDVVVLVMPTYARVDGRIVHPALLPRAIAAAIASRGSQQIVLRADRRTIYGSLRGVFVAARDHRIPVVLLSADTSVLDQVARQRRAYLKCSVLPPPNYSLQPTAGRSLARG